MSRIERLEDITLHHLTIRPEQTQGNDGLGRIFLLPGSDGRAEEIASRLKNVEVARSKRRLDAYLGRITRDGRTADIGVVSTGMGCASLDIVVTELIAAGARTFLRVGTSGSLQPNHIRVGDFVVARAAVRDESVSDRYVSMAFPALADRLVVDACCRAAENLGLGARTFAGIIHSKDSLFAREFGMGPLRDDNERFMESLRSVGVLASEMEAAHLFVLSAVHGTAIGPIQPSLPVPGRAIRSGAILAIIGDDRPFAPKDEVGRAIENLVDLALESALNLVEMLPTTAEASPASSLS